MTEKCTATCKDGTPCQAYPVEGSDKCRMHRGTNTDGESHDGNDWAAKHGAYSESFVQDFLTDKEIERVEQMREILETPEGAKADARLTAAILKEQWRRTGDERFARRYESICDTFGIAPNDEVDVSGEVEFSHDMDSDTKKMLADLMDRDVQQ
jgi:hypothetical protein